MNTLIFVTNNQHKLKEIREILAFGYKVSSLKDIGLSMEIEETGATFHENALLKAMAVSQAKASDCFADDSGLSVTALNGRPGVRSARYAGEKATHAENRSLLLHEMTGVVLRDAEFITVICLLLLQKPVFFEGKIKGQITMQERGDNGFGYDSVFIPDGYHQTFAEMQPEQKNKISHRALAVEQMRKYLVNTIA